MSSKVDNEKRVRIRAHVDFEVIVVSGDIRILAAHTFDISVSGMLINSNEKLAVGKQCETLITLRTTDPIILRMKGHVVRQIENGFAISFDDMDEETLMHLKNLVMYNAEDPSAAASQNKKQPGFK